MKNFCIIFLLSLIILLTAVGFVGTGAPQSSQGGGEYLRIHIRANSNEEVDQAVKYLVRDSVVEFLTPLVAEYDDKEEAMLGLKENLRQVEEEANRVLEGQGFTYTTKAKLTTERFPTRAYGEYVLPAGAYSALVLELGEGSGDNWWCVVYPPLCFAGENTNVIYKSKIKEIIRRFYIQEE